MTINFRNLSTKIGLFVSRNVLCRKSPDAIFFAKGKENLGDSMVPWLIEKITDKKYPYSNPLKKRGNHLLSIGSILQYATSDCFIWGSGFIQKNSRTKGRPNFISALRGPLTRERLLNLGIEAPNVFGDPALLTSRFVIVERRPIAGKVGFIPHYVDWDAMASSELRKSERFEFIDIRTSDIEEFAKQINSCELIISTSLHGLIISESFGIPVIWCKFSDRVVGDGFKFVDYFSGSGRKVQAANSEDLISGKFSKYVVPKINGLVKIQDDLIAAFPEKYI